MKRGCALLLGCVGMFACNAPPLGGGCNNDTQCLPTQACLADVCVDREPGPRLLHVAVFPAPGTEAASTEFTNVAFGAAVVAALPLSEKVAVAGNAKAQPTSQFAQLAQGELALAAQLPSLIPGAPPVQINTVAAIKMPGSAAFKFTVPRTRLNEVAAIAVLPRAPVDTVTPPLLKSLALTEGMEFELPGLAELRVVEGSVRNEFNQAAFGYVAEVFRDGQLVSARAPVGVDGRFRVNFTKSPDPATDAAVLQLSSPGTAPSPRLFFALPPMATDAGVLRFPAHPLPQIFRVPVVGRSAMGASFPVVAALLRFETKLPATGVGVSARFQQDVQAGESGTVDVPLIAGALEGVRDYSVKVTSPSFSEAASQCVASFAVGAAASDSTNVPTTALIELPLRPALAGVLRRADLTVLRGAVVTAVRLGPLPGAVDCGVPNLLGDAVTTTDAEGAFRLRVDAGLFRVQVRPPQGEAVPFTVWNATVTNDGLLLNLTMPAGRVVDGKVLTPAQTPCAACGVVVYEGPLTDLATLRAETITDPQGGFRVVLPAP